MCLSFLSAIATPMRSKVYKNHWRSQISATIKLGPDDKRDFVAHNGHFTSLAPREARVTCVRMGSGKNNKNPVAVRSTGHEFSFRKEKA